MQIQKKGREYKDRSSNSTSSKSSRSMNLSKSKTRWFHETSPGQKDLGEEGDGELEWGLEIVIFGA